MARQKAAAGTSTVDLGNGPQPIRYTLLTLMVYEQEFDGADLIADAFATRDGEPITWSRLTRLLWAGLRAADQSVPPFREWLESLDGDIDVDVVLKTAHDEAARRLFRSSYAALEGQSEQ